MRSEKQSIRAKVAEILELPQEAIADIPKITLYGDRHLLVENHRGIIEFGTELIRIALEKGELHVHGEGLGIRHVYATEVEVGGLIGTLTLAGRQR